VGKAAFEKLSPPSRQLFAIISTHSALVGLHRLLLRLLALPVSLASLLPLGNIGGNFKFLHLLKYRPAVIALVRH